MLTWSTTFSTLNQGSPLVVTYVTTPTVGLVPETGLLNVTDTCTTEEISLNQGNAGGRPCPGLAFSLTDANFGAVQMATGLLAPQVLFAGSSKRNNVP